MMTWAKIDDQFHSHPKIRRAWKCRPALGLHVLALSYCADQLTDGIVDLAFVEERLPAKRERNSVISALTSAGLWREHPDGFEINDYLDYNPSRDGVLARRADDVRRKADARASRAAELPPDSSQLPDGFRAGSALPDPTRPLKEEKDQREERQKRPRPRMGGPSHDEANAAGLSWAARKRDLEGGDEP